MIGNITLGLSTLYQRRLALITKTPRGIFAPMATSVLFALVIAPALAEALGGFNPDIDYMTYVVVASAALLVPLNSMFHGLNVIIDRESGILRELLVAPVRRAAITFANALGVLSLALAQVALVFVLGAVRGAEFDTSVSGVAWTLSAVTLLSIGTYGLAEVLALSIGREDEYISLTPAVAIMPWFLAGSLFPISVLPAGLEQLSLALPWTHALALLRFGLMEGTNPGLEAIWHMDSDVLMAGLSLAVLAAYAVVMLTLAVRVFHRKTMV